MHSRRRRGSRGSPAAWGRTEWRAPRARRGAVSPWPCLLPTTLSGSAVGGGFGRFADPSAPSSSAGRLVCLCSSSAASSSIAVRGSVVAPPGGWHARTGSPGISAAFPLFPAVLSPVQSVQDKTGGGVHASGTLPGPVVNLGLRTCLLCRRRLILGVSTRRLISPVPVYVPLPLDTYVQFF